MSHLAEFPIGEAWEQRQRAHDAPCPVPADLLALPAMSDRLQLAHEIGDLGHGPVQGPKAGVRPVGDEPDGIVVGLRIRNALVAALYGVRGGLRARPEGKR